MRRLIALAFVALACVAAPHRYGVSGLVLAIDEPRRTVLVSHGAIEGYMEAMSMPFQVRTSKLLKAVHPGDNIAFTLVVDRAASWIENIRVLDFDSAERDPAQAGRLKLLGSLMANGEAATLAIGQRVPDYTLTDQTGSAVALSQFAGKVVVINFIYTRCPLPDYCFRLSNNFGQLQKRFAKSRDLMLLSVTFDPANDSPEVLARYSQIWKADAKRWRFLTGPAAEVQRVCAMFGAGSWPDEGLLTHSLHTAVIDRQGKLVANMEGNRYTAQQLGDLVETVMTQSH